MKMNNKVLIYSFLTLTVLSTFHEKRRQTARFIASDTSEKIALLEKKICEQKSMLEKLQDSVEKLMTSVTTFMASLPQQTDSNLSNDSLAKVDQSVHYFDQLRASYASSSYFAMAASKNAIPYTYDNVSDTPPLEKAVLQYQAPNNVTESQKGPGDSGQTTFSFDEYEKRQFDFSDNPAPFVDRLEYSDGEVPKYYRSSASVTENSNN